MSKKLDLVGKRFERLLVIDSAASNTRGRSQWLCQCDCGEQRIVTGINLTSGGQASCGCLKDEKTSTRFTTHGASKSPAGSNWSDMLQRCNNPKSTSYKYYGGRGRKVCECLSVSAWNLVFVAGDKPSPKHTIERIDNDLHYSCGFCRQCQRMGWNKNVMWATRREQARNRSTTRLITLNGETKCLSDWASIAGVKPDTFANRVRLGRDPFQPIAQVKFKSCAAS